MIKIEGSFGFQGKDLEVLQLAVTLANQALTSASFKEKILSSKTTGGKVGFSGTENTPEQVLAKVVFPQEIGLCFTLESPPWYKRWTREIARETPNGPVFNARKFPCGGVAGVAGTVAHEFCHRLGYIHDYYASADRAASVPYRVGDFVEEIVKTLLPEKEGT